MCWHLTAEPDGENHHAEGHEEPGENHEAEKAADPRREIERALVGLRSAPRILPLLQGLRSRIVPDESECFEPVLRVCFWPSGSGSVSQRIRILLSSKNNCKKDLGSYCFVTSL